MQHLGINEDRITTIHLGIDKDSFQRIQNEELLERVKEKHFLPSKYFLYVGGADFRKNVIRLVNAFGKIASSVEEDLVLVGKWYPEVDRYIATSVTIFGNTAEGALSLIC